MKKLGFGAAALVSVLHAQAGDFRLRLLEPGPFHERELVRVEVTEAGREWQFTGFLVEPAKECGTQAKPCTPGSVRMQWDGGGIMSPSQARVIPVNHYVPGFGPGHYRLRALARRMVYVTNGNSSYGTYAEPAEYSTTGTVEFDVLASNAAWVAQVIAQCTATLKGSPRNQEEHEAFNAAAQQLAWLDTAASREAAMDALPNGEGALLNGLRSTREGSSLCDRMQARVPLPTQSVSPQYMFTLIGVCGDVHLPAVPVVPGGRLGVRAVLSAVPPKPVPVTPATIDPAMQEWQQKYRTYTEGLWTRSAAALAASLPQKQPEAKLQAFTTLLQRVSQVRAERPPQPDPEWVPAMSAEFARFYPSIDVARRHYLLDMFTATIRGADTIPLLESIMDAWKPGEYYEAVQSALRALNAIDPARAQARIRAELVRPETWLDLPQLDLLPASAAPPMDDELIEVLAVAQRPPGWNPNLRMAALAKYGTPQALPRIKAIYESQQQPCQPELVAYFVRVEPSYADRIFHSHPWDMHARPAPCMVAYFERTPRLAMSPGLKEYISAYLMSGEIYVKTTSARTLGRYGTSAALPKIWDALRYFGEWWKGKGAELAKNGEGIAFEVELRNAVARGRGWLATDSDLRKLEAQCVSDWCRGETQADLRWWDGPLRIELHDGQNRVAQYSNLETLTALEAKLEQFPRGTRFAMSGTGKDADAVRQFAAAHGLLIE